MTNKVFLTILCLAFSCVSMAPAIGQDKKKSPGVDALYQEFVDQFRKTEDKQKRIELIQSASKKINELLADKLLKTEIKEILPKLINVRLLDLDKSFVQVIDEHPDEKVKALALLCFAKHCGNNGRDETAKKSLAFLKKKYEKLEYTKDQTFGKAAQEAFYFLNNLAVGKKAPQIAGPDADGALFRLADYRGKVVMLRFWGDWCPACRAMFDYERELVARYKNDAFALIGVNSDKLKQLKAAQKRANLTWRTIWDGGTTHGPIATIFRVKHWPTIVVVDAKGVIRFRSQGLSKPQLEKVLERCLAEADETNADTKVVKKDN